MSNLDERRAEKRIDEKTTVFVEVTAAEFDNSQPANVIVCNSLDLSSNGLQVMMEQEVKTGSILRLCAEFDDVNNPLYLVGEVKWVTRCDHQFRVGFELYDAENTDIVGWKKVIAAMQKNDKGRA